MAEASYSKQVFDFVGKKKNSDEEPKKFSCVLVKKRCRGRKKDGRRCKRSMVFGTELCFHHLLHDKNVKIVKDPAYGGRKVIAAFPDTESHLAEGGRPRVVFKKNHREHILDYEGEKVNKGTAQQRYGAYTAPYYMNVRDQDWDSACDRGVASIINSSVTSAAANVKFGESRDGTRAFIKVRGNKDIYEGEELKVKYSMQDRYVDRFDKERYEGEDWYTLPRNLIFKHTTRPYKAVDRNAYRPRFI